MIKRLLILIIAASLLSSCTWRYNFWQHFSHPKSNKPLVSTPKMVKITQKTSPFTKVNVTGKLDVCLHPQSTFDQIVIHGDSRDVENIQRSVIHNELFISFGKGYPKGCRPKIDIYMRNIISFTYHGFGDVIAKNFVGNCMDLLIDNQRTTLLDGAFSVRKATFMNTGQTKLRGLKSCAMVMDLRGNTDVKLVGYANVASINMSENSKLSLYWIKSKLIKVALKDRAKAQLAGVAETLDAKLCDKSRLNARYLMSKNSFIKTYNDATAEISVTKNQHTLAQDRSNIYYYFLPETKTDFMAADGSVLDMREWERPFLKSTDRYNQ
ncbi:MAG: hypothetical protein A3E88_00445 [Legionellales bacterium RIFCSPHIGHO2_12_FULL_35_11]|nr:MAG: hypothetical protein A3E88_00445 [Legionellales bacterium RIFCSPHIGHO2_12_FULL_35_11]